jgi:hypothetical protein
MCQFARQGKNPRSHRGANADHYRHKQAHISSETDLFRHKDMLPNLYGYQSIFFLLEQFLESCGPREIKNCGE